MKVPADGKRFAVPGDAAQRERIRTLPSATRRLASRTQNSLDRLEERITGVLSETITGQVAQAMQAHLSRFLVRELKGARSGGSSLTGDVTRLVLVSVGPELEMF